MTKLLNKIFLTRPQRQWKQDKRFLRAHIIFHVGKFCLLTGSALLVFGLLCKFIFAEDTRNTIPKITVIISSIGCTTFTIGLICVGIAFCKSQKARNEEMNGPNGNTPKESASNMEQIQTEMVHHIN